MILGPPKFAKFAREVDLRIVKVAGLREEGPSLSSPSASPSAST